MAKKDYERLTEELITPIIEAHHFELVDVEWVKEGSNWYLRVYIDKEGGITVDDCEIINREFGDVLDEKDYISENYIFEVSSPGLDRPLKKEKDFVRSIGKDVEIRLYKPIDKKKEYVGTLESYDKNSVTIALEDGQKMTFERSAIALIRLAFFY
ncbi:MAG TPA: ribosome maturation factor RimP [Candidatus Scybalocola faecigallinarum]|uniref:Ribosome maturation factor RimP n=1 Tax=Candidatus Scybalocola faecigallinarum TaxID=2840941 RepID=A0A9D1F5U7_9FIRM|nr:ribosome maturation factor RimP [Candidatus Scybalocola faecigallinarum]